MSEIYEKIDYKGYRINIMQDIDAFDPYKDGDYMPPALTFYLGNRRIESKLDFCWDDISRLLEKKHVRTKKQRENLADIYGESYSDMLIESRDYHGEDTEDRFLDLLLNRSRMLCTYWSEAVEYFEALECLCKIVGVKCLNKKSNSNGQGDSILVFMAATPKFINDMGIDPENIDAALLADYNTYHAWCWGDCYGYNVTKVFLDEDGEEDHEDETNESCWGFYGNNHKDSGLLEAAENAIDYMIENELEDAAKQAAWEAEENLRIHEAACRDIVTVG